MEKLGIISGGGHLPKLIIRACQQQKRSFFVLGLMDHVDPDTLDIAMEADIVRLGEIGKGLSILREAGVTQVVLVGSVRRPSLREMRPDLTAIKWLSQIGLNAFGDDGLLRGVIECLEKSGMSVLGAQDVLDDVLMPANVLTQVVPGDWDAIDMERGLQVAQSLGRLDVGQSIIVEHGVVLGVEAIEGTQLLLERCRSLKREPGRSGVLVKVCKPHQDKRVDLPTIGLDTIAQIVACDLNGIYLEAGSSFVLDKQQVVRAANDAKIFLYGFDGKTSQFDRLNGDVMTNKLSESV